MTASKKTDPIAELEASVRKGTVKPSREKAPARVQTIRIRQVRSGICAPLDQKQTLRGLGLRRPHDEVVRPDNPSIRGMVRKVRHLVEVIHG
jgi:large subunit ribosomal protein L30